MFEFLFLSSLLAFFGVAFVVVPLMRKAEDSGEEILSDDDRKAQNVAIFKDRLSELENEREKGGLSPEQFEKLKTELERTLLADVEGLETSARQTVNSAFSKLLLGLLALVFVAGSYGLYFHWGSLEKQIQAQAMRFDQSEIARAEEAARTGDMSGLIQQLYDKLQGAPDNIEGWMMLARTSMNVENYPMAVEAYTQVVAAIERQDENPAPALGLLAQAHYFAAGGRMTDEALAAVRQAQRLDPGETNTLGLLAIDAFASGAYAVAVQNWERLLAIAPEHPARASIEAGIARAKGLAGIEEAAPAVQTDPGVQAEITVTVSLDESLRDRVSGNETVFIFARSPVGPPMPLAASRHSVAELPLTVVLNDSKAMAPMARLSQVERADIVARISFSGEPVAQPGDLYAKAEGIPVKGSAAISLTIDQEEL